MIDQNELEQIVNQVKQQGLSDQLISSLRDQYSDRHFTYCTEDDINTGKPIVEEEGFAVYLVNSQDHCSVLTNDLEKASGYVLVELIDE